MSSYTQRLAARNTGTFSPESAEVDQYVEPALVETSNISGDDCDEHLEHLHATTAEIAEHATTISESETLSEALDRVIDGTISAYGEQGIDERGAELMKLSVESILRVAGINIPIRTIVPSFESNMTRSEYSAEAEEKKDGIIARIWAILKAAYTALVASIRSFFSRMKDVSQKVEAYLDTVKEKVSKTKGAPKDLTVKTGKFGFYMMGHGGRIVVPGAAIRMATEDYGKFIVIVEKELGDMNRIPSFPMNADNQHVFTVMDTFIAQLAGRFSTGMVAISDARFLPNQRFVIKHGEGKSEHSHGAIRPMTGAKGSVVTDKVEVPTECNSLTIHDMETGLNMAGAALATVKKVETTIADWLKSSDRLNKDFARVETNVSRSHGVDATFKANLLDNSRAIVSATSLYGTAYTSTLPLMLQFIRMNLGFIEHCSESFRDVEMKEVPAPKRPLGIGHDKKEAEDGPVTIDHVA